MSLSHCSSGLEKRVLKEFFFKFSWFFLAFFNAFGALTLLV